MTDYNVLFLQGPSGSGKSTLCQSLLDDLDWIHLDRDQIKGTREEVYQIMQKELGTLLREGRRVIVDAPFFYQTEKQFQSWVLGIEEEINYFTVTVKTPPEIRKQRRQKRDYPRDRIDDREELLRYEEKTFRDLPGSLRLPGDAPLRLQKEVLLWCLGIGTREILMASEKDLKEIHDLKYSVLKESFRNFLDPEELELELEQVASKKAVSDLIEQESVFLAKDSGRIKAILSLSFQETERGKEAKISSGYSLGQYAGTALGLLVISRCLDMEIDFIRAHVYRDNKKSKKILGMSSFLPSGKTHINPRIPRVPVEHWYREIS